MNKKILEISAVIIFTLFILIFLLNYEFSFSIVPTKFSEVIWNYRIIESLSMSILIFASLMGILIWGKE
jgi:hypothetical protein